MIQTLYVDTDNIEHVLTLLMIGLVHHRSPKRAFYELCSVGGSRLMSAFGGRALGAGRRSDRIQDSLQIRDKGVQASLQIRFRPQIAKGFMLNLLPCLLPLSCQHRRCSCSRNSLRGIQFIHFITHSILLQSQKVIAISHERSKHVIYVCMYAPVFKQCKQSQWWNKCKQ